VSATRRASGIRGLSRTVTKALLGRPEIAVEQRSELLTAFLVIRPVRKTGLIFSFFPKDLSVLTFDTRKGVALGPGVCLAGWKMLKAESCPVKQTGTSRAKESSNP